MSIRHTRVGKDGYMVRSGRNFHRNLRILLLSAPLTIFQPEEFKNAKDKKRQQHPIEGVDNNFLISEFFISSGSRQKAGKEAVNNHKKSFSNIGFIVHKLNHLGGI